MKYFLAIFILLSAVISPIYGSDLPTQDENAAVIINKTFIKNPKMKELFYMFATKRIAESNKKIDIEKFMSSLMTELERKENFKKFSDSYTKRFDAKEIAEIRKFIESEVFEKYSENSFYIMKEYLQNLDKIIDKMIGEEEGSLSPNTVSKVTEITSDNFNDEIQDSKLPVVLDFYADWCGPCKGMQVILESLSEKYEGQIKFTKLNVDHEKEIAEKFRVKDLPVVVFIKEGKITGVHSGFADKDTLNSKIKELLL